MNAVAGLETPPRSASIGYDERAEREQRRADAERWLASLPSRTVLRRSNPGTSDARLVMYKTGASTPEFWEKAWLVSPPYRMKGYKLPAWYRSVFRHWLPREGLILEAGCGNGNLVRMLVNDDPERWGNFARAAGGGASVVGIDFAEKVIAESQRIHPEGDYRAGDVRGLPFRDGELAAYISMGVMEHFDEAERAAILAEAARSLRPDGVAIITVPYFSPVRRICARFGRFADESTIVRSNAELQAHESRLEFYQHYFKRREIARQIERAGFRIATIDGYDCRKGWTDVLPGRNALAWIERRGAWWSRLIEQPPRLVRRTCPHMLLLIAHRR